MSSSPTKVPQPPLRRPSDSYLAKMLRRNSSGGLRGSGARLSHTEPGADVTVPPELQVADDDAGMTKGWSAENLPVLVDDASSPTASSPTADDSILPSGQRCWYTDSAGAKVRATVLSVHDDDVVPYYTVKLAGGKERHTTRARLQPKAVSNLSLIHI